MRILLAIHNAYTDSTSGAAHSIRILMQWLSEAGHACQVLGTARFDGNPPSDIHDHLAQLGIPLTRKEPARAFVRGVRKPANVTVGRPTVHFTLTGVPVTMLMTRHHEPQQPDRIESEQFLFLIDELLTTFAPDVFLTYGSHPV